MHCTIIVMSGCGAVCVLMVWCVCHLHYLFVTCCVPSHPLGLRIYHCTLLVVCLVYLMYVLM